MKLTQKHDKIPFIQVIGKVRLVICLIIIVAIAIIGPQLKGTREVPWDIQFLNWLHTVIPPSIGEVLKIIYIMTGANVTAFVVLGSLGYLFWKRYWEEAKYLAFASLGILLLIDQILKPIFGRIRPGSFSESLASLVNVDGKSFPSGHSAGSVVFYFYMAFLLSTHFPHLKKYIYLGAMLWVGLIGLSSTYCRVHWATDIIAGYSVGFVWLTLAIALLQRAAPETYYFPKNQLKI
ncbi:MAG: phosphatase PAP2 family protein [Snowella sp.]|nr:phosphatase PAP2 family protein [Snowella sp.]